MPTMKHLAIAAGVLCQICTTLLIAEPRIHYQEDFHNYGPVAPLASPISGNSVENDPIWTQRAEAIFRPTADGPVFKHPLAADAPAGVTAFDVLFELCFRGENQRRFDLIILNADGGEMRIQFTPTGVALSGTGAANGVSANATFADEIPSGQWRQVAVTVRDGAIAVHVADAQHALQPVLQAKAPTIALGGINFIGYANEVFALTKIVVRDPAPLPERSIARLLPTPPEHNDFQFGAQKPVVDVPANDVFGATLRVGSDPQGARMIIRRKGEEDRVVTFTVAPIRGRFNEADSARRKSEDHELPDAIIRIAGLTGQRQPIDYHVRPKLRRYFTSYSYTDVYHDIVRDWDKLPKASEYPLTIECRRAGDGVDVYLNGAVATRIPGELDGLRFELSGAAGIREVVSRAAEASTDRYLPLDVAVQRMGRSFVSADPSIPAGIATIEGIPMRVANGGGSADVGLTRQGQGNWALEVDEYLARSPFDGFLTEVHFAVPAAPYHTAWVLCAVDPDPAKDPILTARLTHYIENGIGNNMLADVTMHLPRDGDAPGEGVRQVGTVRGKSADGRDIDVPLYLVEMRLPVGSILDLVNERDVLNFEFFGKPWENFQQLDNRSKPDPNSTSAVQVYGVTLETSPVTLEMVQAQPGNIFHNDERPVTSVRVRALSPASGSIAWEIRDVDGKPVAEGDRPYQLAAAGAEASIEIPLDQPQPGWYELLIHARDDQGRTLLTHPARFALLGQDTRKAGYESPFGTWWFDGAHLTPSSLDFAGPIMFKAGIRKAAWTKLSEADMARYVITQDQVNMPFTFKDLQNPEKAVEIAKKKMDEVLAKYPHLREVLVYHESGPGNDLPIELFGIKPEITEALIKREKRYADLYNLAGAFFREHYPQLKLVVGNNSASQSVIAAIFRHGGDPQYIDYIGIESPSQVFIPEKLQEWALQGHHIARDTAKVLTGRDVPATGCYEFTYRADRDMGEQQQAEWYARDVLISLANGFTRIGPGILFDTANSYHNGLWGGSGILQRGPWGYPKKSYVAYATLTRVLDQVTLRRQIPTGSTTVYALEFDRPEGRIVTALWAARGEVEFVVSYAADAQVEVIDMYGRSQTRQAQAGRLSVDGGTAPIYLIADKPAESIQIGRRGFAKDQGRAALATVAAPLDSADAIAIVDDNNLDTPLTPPLQTPVRRQGPFNLRQVTDEQKGQAIELALDASTEAPGKYVTEYAILRLAQPAQIEGEPAAIGVWVKGNSNWGRIMFEIRDAEGEVWRSLGTGGWGCDILDWPGNIAVNFDGWNFVALPLRDTALFNDHSPGPVLEQWVSSGGNKRIDYPISVTGLIVEMNRSTIDLRDFKPVEPVIRLKDISGVNER